MKKISFLWLLQAILLLLLMACYSEQQTPPEENRFTRIVLDERLDEPMELAILPDMKVLFIERKGAVKLFDPSAHKTVVVAHIPVSTKYKDRDGVVTEAEDGLLGLALDPDYAENHWIYLYYSAAGEEARNVLARYEFKEGKLDMGSEKVLLEVPTQREQCCHTGGSIAFDAAGNLYLSTGDNTSSRGTLYAPIDNRPGREPWDAQKSSSNTNDLRGKILRIRPQADGTYTIPEGNLFPEGTALTRPEIYIMGVRNPFRISVDKKTGRLYWGDVGPDASTDSLGMGPRSYDEINQATGPGFYGWPYFVGNNAAYHARDFITGEFGGAFDPEKPVNFSPSNTGLNKLPPAKKAFIWYPYGASEEFPLLGNGGRSAMAGEVFRSENFKQAARPFPSYYDGKLFIYEWMRGWIMVVTMDKQGNYVSMERFMPGQQFNNPIDMAFAPDGDLYLLEYGSGWFKGNEDARLVRIEYNKGNRKPEAVANADRLKGKVPLTARFSAQGTTDPDSDRLDYQWTVRDQSGQAMASMKGEEAAYTFAQPGVYTVELEVKDTHGASSARKLNVIAGNEPPELSLHVAGNQNFFFPGRAISYEVSVRDAEDGSLEEGSIAPGQVSFTIDYLQGGYDLAEIAQGHVQKDGETALFPGKNLIETGDCRSCHQLNEKSIGPSYLEIARKYKAEKEALAYLSGKIIRGGSGVWGKVQMPAHPNLQEKEAVQIAEYILNLAGTDPGQERLPLSGTYTPSPERTAGAYVIRAAYTDQGAPGAPPATVEKVLVLRNAQLPPANAHEEEHIMKYNLPDPPMDLIIFSANDASLLFRGVDLTGILRMVLVAIAPAEGLHAMGGEIEIRTGSPKGPLIGKSGLLEIQQGALTTLQPQIISLEIKPTRGIHDLYFIGKHEKAASGQPLFILLDIQLMPSLAVN